ncbi:MAG: response regulator [Ruminococcus flavefaciens]|nr:response regulator [Ruminococcus flavefaciens]MCM1229337.1 response regulator [Ruminococcus flavefaciens]
MYNVLLVEDDTALRFIYSKMKTWSECGFRISAEATNGKHALEILENQSFDLIFTDIRMPFIDGIELLRKLNDMGNTIPVVFASSYDEFEYARQGLILGAFDYLLKPVEQKKLAEVLNRAKDRIDELSDKNKIAPVVADIIGRLDITADEDNFVNQVSVYCSEHYTEPFTVDDIADAQGYSKDYFSKLFKHHFGITFHDFHSKLKIGYAVELIRTGNYKTYEISDMLGYSSVDYFTKIFKEITGVTPSKYKSGDF